MTYEHIAVRPPISRRPKGSNDDIDLDMEKALIQTYIGASEIGGAVKIPLAQFHSSPVKGRLFARGFKLKHRVLDRETVAAWLE